MNGKSVVSLIEIKLELIFKKSKIFLSIVETLDIIELSITLFLNREVRC
jgi:hypothetical protein